MRNAHAQCSASEAPHSLLPSATRLCEPERLLAFAGKKKKTAKLAKLQSQYYCGVDMQCAEHAMQIADKLRFLPSFTEFLLVTLQGACRPAADRRAAVHPDQRVMHCLEKSVAQFCYRVYAERQQINERLFSLLQPPPPEQPEYADVLREVYSTTACVSSSCFLPSAA